jgi:hypothetical protein
MSPDDSPELAIRPMQEADLPAADRNCRVAFGTFVGIPQPETFFGDADYCQTRFRSDPSASFVAVLPGAGATQRFEGLLAACEAFAAERGLERLEVGANTART